VDWWQTIVILSGIGLISVIIGMFAGIPLSNIILRRKEQLSIGKYRVSSGFKPQYTTTDQFDELLKKYGVAEPGTAEQGNEEAAERGNDGAETAVGQVEPVTIDLILLELEKNLKISIKPRLDELEPFQTEIWDNSLDIPDILTADLKWELAEAYLDMYAANNIVWFLKEFNTKSPVLEDQYTKMCNQITITLDKVIQVLKPSRSRDRKKRWPAS
jgi:hypothetical protein